MKDQKEKTSQELIKNLNELTTSLNWERKESKKKDEQINTLTKNHNDEIVDLKNQLDTLKKGINSNELIKNLNEVTTSLNHERKEIKKKDEQINTLTYKHNAEIVELKNQLSALKRESIIYFKDSEKNKLKVAEIVELKNQLEASKKESSINLKDAEENKRKVAELETKVSDMMFQQTVADQDEMENIKKIQELKNQLTAEQAKNKTFGDNSENLEVLIKENERLNTNVRTLTEQNKGT